MNALTQAYIEALYFTDTGDIDQPTTGTPLAPEALEQIQRDCALFEYVAAVVIPEGAPCGSSYTWTELAGHDFWLTRNRHGAGFWDGDWPEPAASQLTILCRMFGEVSVYAGDDGLIYLTGGKTV